MAELKSNNSTNEKSAQTPSSPEITVKGGTQPKVDFSGDTSLAVDRKNAQAVYFGSTLVLGHPMPESFNRAVEQCQNGLEEVFGNSRKGGRFHPHPLDKLHLTVNVMMRGFPGPDSLTSLDDLNPESSTYSNVERDLKKQFNQRWKAMNEVLPEKDARAWLHALCATSLESKALHFTFEEVFIAKDGNVVVKVNDPEGRLGAFREAISSQEGVESKHSTSSDGFIVIGKIVGGEELKAREISGSCRVLSEFNHRKTPDFSLDTLLLTAPTRQRNLLSIDESHVIRIETDNPTSHE